MFIPQFILKSCRSCISVLAQHYIKVEQRMLSKIQSRIDLFPVFPRAFIKPVWSGIESSTTLFHCYHQTTWFVCLVQFIFDQFLILIVLERLTLCDTSKILGVLYKRGFLISRFKNLKMKFIVFLLIFVFKSTECKYFGVYTR